MKDTEVVADERRNRRLDISASSVETEFVRRLLLEDLDGDCESSSVFSSPVA